MENKIKAFMDYVKERNANEPEFLQAVHEVTWFKEVRFFFIFNGLKKNTIKVW